MNEGVGSSRVVSEIERGLGFRAHRTGFVVVGCTFSGYDV